MSGRVSPVSSMASHDQSAPETEQFDSHRRSRPPTQPGPQQPWYPPNYYHQYPGTAQYPINNFAPYPPVAAHNVPAQDRWRVFDLFDEEEQERRNRGKELVPTRHLMSGPPPPWAYPGGYGPGAYAPLEASMWPALPPSQPAPLPLIPLPLPDDSGYPPRKPVKHVRHQGQLPEPSLRQRYRSQQSENKIIRDVDGILTPSSGDLTVHLTMDIEEDLEDRLDEMSRLSRLGDFASARKYFQEHLHHHIDNPYVLVHYADLLLHQGDFKAVTLLKDDVMYKDEGEQSNSEELRILRVNWELLLLLAKSKTLDTLSGADTVFEEAVSVLTAMAKDPSPDRPISSTEIEILALTIQLTGHPVLNSKWLRYGARAIAASSSTFSRLYQTLLRQGRIWDFHDIIVLLPTMEDIKALTYDIFHKDLIPSLKAMVSDWSDSVHGYDTSTTLGLLSILTHILLEPVEASEKECVEILKLCLPLALSVTKNDPSSLKSRSYLRVLLAKSRFAEAASRQAIDTLATQLQSAQGVFYQPDIASLPIYVPSGNETPRWTTTDQPAELKAPIGLVLRGAIEMGDLKTEVLARQELIRLSGDPREEFNKLCDLQLARQGNLNDYGLSLASKYLVSNTKAAKEELAISISRLLSRTASTDYWDASHEWILNMLLYKLEGRSHSTIKHMLERSHTDYHNMEGSLLREISRKMPSLKDWVDQQTENSTQTKIQDTVLRAGSGSRRSTKHASKRARSSATARTVERPPTRERQSPVRERNEERDVHLMARSEPNNRRRDHDLVPEGGPPHIHPIINGQQTTVDQPRTSQQTPVITIRGPNSDVQEARAPLHGDELVVRDLSASERRQNDVKLATQIREKLEAEFDKKLEAEKESEQERRNERMIILEGLKKEVEAIRREAVEQAEKKARIEDQERAERIRWETRQESALEKEMALAKSEAAAAELAAREMAIKEAERRMREEYEIRKRKREPTRKLRPPKS
ncbi:hypothetical protein F5Y07DRAFT_192557 [Xylaria sp. FL0933]|nr:hypothetical protein F5Y07DRAFT_192557 [Xylaria sp. FL0933]